MLNNLTSITEPVLETLHFEFGVPESVRCQEDEADDEDEVGDEMEQEKEDDDYYGQNEAESMYCGIRTCAKRKAYAQLSQVEAGKWIVVVAESSSKDSFYTEGSDTPMWLAHVDSVTQEGDADTRKLNITWWAPQMRNGVNRYTAEDRFFECPGKTGKDVLDGVDHTQLVVINFVLNGTTKKKSSGGKIPKLVLKKITKVVVPTEAQRLKSTCPVCTEEPKSGPTIICTQCGQLYHHECTRVFTEDDEWCCIECSPNE